MHILHTESSNGWGGQEIRILAEAEGMRKRGHDVIFAVARGGGLVSKAREKGFVVYELNFKKQFLFATLPKLLRIMRRHRIDLVNTHSSLDAWIGGGAARIGGRKIIRTRHLSTSIRPGLNSRLLYRFLADYVVTTSSSILSLITAQSGLPSTRCQCIPTGVDTTKLNVSSSIREEFRARLGVQAGDVLVGSVCFVRSWKGIDDFLKAALILKNKPHLKWVIVGGGYVDRYRVMAKEMGLEGHVVFTGHLEDPYAAIAGLDIFTLLSTAHEGISQASLQAAYLEKPLLVTTIGGLPEVCIDGKTGILVPPAASEKVSEAILRLASDIKLRREMGANAKRLVLEKFTLEHTLDAMEQVYGIISSCAIV